VWSGLISVSSSWLRRGPRQKTRTAPTPSPPPGLGRPSLKDLTGDHVGQVAPDRRRPNRSLGFAELVALTEKDTCLAMFKPLDGVVESIDSARSSRPGRGPDLHVAALTPVLDHVGPPRRDNWRPI